MPIEQTKNFIEIRIDTQSFDKYRIIDIDKSKGIKARIGIKEGKSTTTHYLFSKEKWTVTQAKKWVTDHGHAIKNIDFEEIMSKKNKNHIEYKSFSFELKDIDEKGKFQGLLSTNGNIDPVNDRFNPGTWNRTIRDRTGNPFPFLKGHNPNTQIGSFIAKDKEVGLWIDARLNLITLANGTPAVPNAYEQYALYKEGDAKGLSVGFRPIPSKTEWPKVNGVVIRDIFEAQLIEGSTTPIPMNIHASVTNIKDWGDVIGIIINNLDNIDLKNKILRSYGYDPESLTILDPGEPIPNPDIETTHKAINTNINWADVYDLVNLKRR